MEDTLIPTFYNSYFYSLFVIAILLTPKGTEAT